MFFAGLSPANDQLAILRQACTYGMHHYYQSSSKSAGNDFRDGAVVTFQLPSLLSLQALLLFFTFSVVTRKYGTDTVGPLSFVPIAIFRVATKRVMAKHKPLKQDFLVNNWW